MADLSKLYVTIGAKTAEFKQAMAGVDSQLGATQGKFGALGAKIGNSMKVGGAAIAGFGLAVGTMSVKAAVDMDKLYSSIQAGTGATGKDLEGLKKVFKDIGKSAPNDLEDVADTLTELNTRLDLTGEALGDLSKDILDVARMLDEDARGATVAFTTALNRWQIPAQEANRTLDEMFVVSQNTGISITDLSGVMSEYGVVLKNAGFTFGESVALFGSLYESGLSVSRIMPAINMAMRNLAAEGVTDLKGGLYEAFQNMKDAETTAEALNIATQTFGAEGAQRLTDAVRSGNLELDQLVGLMADAEGAVEKFGQETMTAEDKMNQFKNQISLTAAELGEALLPALEDILESVTPMVEGLGDWVANNRDLAATLVKVAIGLGGAMVLAGPMMNFFKVLAGLGRGLVWVLRLLVPAIAAVGGTVAVLAGLIAALIATIGFMVWVIVSARHQIVKDLKAAWHAVQDWFLNLGRTMGGAADWVWDKMCWLGREIKGIWQDVVDFIESIPGRIVDFFKGLGERIGGIFSDMGATVKQWLNTVLDAIRTFSWHYSGWTVAGQQIIPQFTFEPFRGLPSLAQGGIVPGALGQAVPIIAHGGEMVIPSDLIGALSAAATGGGGAINIYVQSMTVREEADVRKLAIELRRETDRKARQRGVTR